MFANLSRWAALAALIALASVALGALGVPSHSLIGATVVGVVAALRFRQPVVIGQRADHSAQAVIGVAIGATLSAATLPELASAWLPVTLVTLGTVLSTIALGLLLRWTSGLDTATAMLASVPGGAVGLVVMAREMGTDERIVAFSQYLRVLLIVIAAPLVATILVVGPGVAVAVAAAAALSGWRFGRTVRLPAPALLGPMVVAAAAALIVPSLTPRVPRPALELAFGLVGLDVGLRFTRDVVRRLARLLPAMALCLAVLLGLSFLQALLLYAMTPVSLLDAYLATTPGGLSVVAATAYGTGANLALITAIQMLRLIVMLATAPALVRLTVRAIDARARADSPTRACPPTRVIAVAHAAPSKPGA
jgi:membrane AbrB-like protein